MDFSGKIGAVKMPLFEALKKMIYNFMQNALVGGGKLKKYEIVSDQGDRKCFRQQSNVC